MSKEIEKVEVKYPNDGFSGFAPNRILRYEPPTAQDFEVAAKIEMAYNEMMAKHEHRFLMLDVFFWFKYFFFAVLAIAIIIFLATM